MAAPLRWYEGVFETDTAVVAGLVHALVGDSPGLVTLQSEAINPSGALQAFPGLSSDVVATPGEAYGSLVQFATESPDVVTLVGEGVAT